MYVHFDLPTDRQTQKKLHQTFRRKIKEWTKLGVVHRAVLTYHFSSPPNPSDSLYVCLDIPAVEKLEQIPSLVMQFVKEVCHDNNIKPKIMNYKLETEQAKKNKEQEGSNYYDNAPVEEILHFASVGTEIACEALEKLEEREGILKNDMELSRFILSRLRGEFGADYKWMIWALHFVCNPLLIPEFFILSPLQRRAIEAIKFDP